MEINPESTLSSIPTTGGFSFGRMPRRTLTQNLVRDRTKRKSKKSNSVPCNKPAFPLSPSKEYGFVVNFSLRAFPRSSVKAVQHFHKLIAPPLTPTIFSLKPEEIRALSQAFMENIQARWAFRKLLLQYLQKKCHVVNEVDPFTLEPIKLPIEIPMVPTRAIYRFESKSLAYFWKHNLLTHDGTFPEPKQPVNPLTNLPFSTFQIHKAFQSIRKNGHSNWILDSYSSCHYDIGKWETKFAMPLRLEAIEQVFADKQSYDRYDMLMDFAELQHEYHDVSFNKNMFHWVFEKKEVEDYAELWVKACKRFYREKYTMLDKDLQEDLEVRTSVMNAYLLEIPQIVKLLYLKYLETQRRNGSRRIQNRVLQN